MAFSCVLGRKYECDGCMCCQDECTEPEWDYRKSFNDEVDELCESISDNLKALRDLVEEYQHKDSDGLTDDIRIVEKHLKEMESALSWIY